MNTANVFIYIQLAAIAVQMFLFIYTKMQKPSTMQNFASLLALNTVLMLSGSILEMQATTLESAYYGTILTYLGEPFLLVSVFNLVCTFYGFKMPKGLFVFMMLLACAIAVIVYTNPLHHLYYSSVTFDPSAKYTPLVLEHGPLYALNLTTVVAYNGGIAIVAVLGYQRSRSPLRRRLSVYSLLMMLSAVTGVGIYFLDITDGYDTSMLGLSVATLFMAILFFRCRIFDVVDAAKDYALDASMDGLLIYDDSGEVVYRNSMAKKVVGSEISKKYIDNASEGKVTYRGKSDNIYSVSTNSIRHHEDYLGKSVEIHDITEASQYSEKLEKAVRETTDKLEKVQRTIIGSFASMVEARSLETGDHIKRVSAYTEIISRTLRENGKFSETLTDNYINLLVHSAPLHDVGKISIPDRILLKPGRLTPDEFEEMKKHSAIGERVIRSTMEGLESEEYVNMAAEVALYHHERWDGNGYPTGLKGADIPLCARIVAVADCYDAMTSERCYKEAFPDAKAIGILLEEAGSHFDPEVVEAFVNSNYRME